MSDTPEFESKAEYIRRMSDDGAGGLADQADIEDNISASFEDIATLVEAVEDLPVTASIRPNGSFSDASSCHEYLIGGGLVVTDDAGKTEPIGFVWVVKEFDEILWQNVFTVYIDDETG